MEVILAGFLDTFTLTNILFIFLGIAMGVFVGAVPGLNGPMAIALAVPMTYYMSPLVGHRISSRYQQGRHLRRFYCCHFAQHAGNT